jgi:hypothetical protein
MGSAAAKAGAEFQLFRSRFLSAAGTVYFAVPRGTTTPTTSDRGGPGIRQCSLS